MKFPSDSRLSPIHPHCHHNSGGHLRFLPPANDVWGKVIFSQVCLIPSVHGGGVCIQGVCIQGGLHLRGLHLGGSASRGSASGGSASGGSASSGVCIWGVGRTPLGYYGIQSTSGLYASYWNAFLSFIFKYVYKTRKFVVGRMR